MCDDSDGSALGTESDDATTLTLVEETQVVIVSVNNFDTPMMRGQRLATLGVEHDRYIHAIVQAPHRIAGVATAIRIGEVIVQRHPAHRPRDDAFDVLTVVVELAVGEAMHQRLGVLVVDVARAVETNARLQVTLEFNLMAMRQRDVVGNLDTDARPEQVGVLNHPLGLLDARLLDVLEHSSHASGVETQDAAIERRMLADVNAQSVHLVRSKIKDSGAVTETLALDGLSVGEVEEVLHGLCRYAAEIDAPTIASRGCVSHVR